MPALRKIADGDTGQSSPSRRQNCGGLYLREFGQWQANGESHKLSRRVFKGQRAGYDA
jgi:hypothetical protein